jgi:hypothetical protein
MRLALAVVAAALCAAAPAAAAEGESVDIDGVVGFVKGSDIAAPGERPLTLFYEAHFGRRETYLAQQPKVEAGFSPNERLHLAFGAWLDHVREEVPGVADDNRWGGGVAAEAKLQLVQRSPATPVGFALLAAPHFSAAEAGERSVSLELALIADTELVRDRLFAAFNLLYEPERVRGPGETEWTRESLFGVSAALVARVTPTVFIGGELQYFRAYDGYFFNTFAGHALYAGPVLTIDISERASLTLAWAAQVAGRAAGSGGNLDLDNFERHRVRARWSTQF